MRTYDASRIRTACVDYTCGNYLPGNGCGGKIKRGDRYLSYARGQRGRLTICMMGERCAFETTTAGPHKLKYHCADMIQEIAREDSDVASEKT